jgi:hypothetical protein
MATKHAGERLSDDRRRRESKRFAFDAVVRPEGGQALLYCSACKANIPHDRVVTGPVQDWPYCPVHQHKALIVRSV